MQHVKGRGRKAAYDVRGNVIWLTCPAKDGRFQRVDPVAELRRSVTRLVGEIERSGKLKADISAAIGARRYELYRRSAALGARASERSLAAAQRIHVDCVLRFVRSIAAAGSGNRAGGREPPPRTDPLAQSIRELQASLERARRLSQDVLAQCRRRDWREGFSPRGQPEH